MFDFNQPGNFKNNFFTTDVINLLDVANNFVSEKANRKQNERTNDIPIKVPFLTKSTQTLAL